MINKDLSYELSALIDADSLFYGILDYQRHLRKASYINLSQVESLVDQIIECKIRKSKVSFVSSEFALVPTHEYSNNIAADLLWHGQKQDYEEYILRNDYCERFNLRVIYAIDRIDFNRVQDYFSSLSIFHFVTACLDACDTDSPFKTIRLTIFENRMVVILHEGKILHLANVYEYSDENEMLYFIGLIFSLYNLDYIKQQIVLSGWIKDDDEKARLINKYFGNVTMAHQPLVIDGFKSPHVYHPIYCVSQCAS